MDEEIGKLGQSPRMIPPAHCAGPVSVRGKQRKSYKEKVKVGTQAQFFKSSNSSTSSSCSITTAKNGFRHQTPMLKSLAPMNSTRTLALFPFLPLTFLNLIASLRVRQDVENGDADAHPSLPLQRRVTKQIMREWDRHKLALSNPPTDRTRDVHKLHIPQSVPMLDKNSALRPNMPQHDNDEGGKPKRLSFSPASSVWGQMGRAWTSGDRNARTTELVTSSDDVAFFHQFLGITNNPALAPFANVPCGCQRYFLGGEGAWDHALLMLPIGLVRTITS